MTVGELFEILAEIVEEIKRQSGYSPDYVDVKVVKEVTNNLVTV